MDNNHSLSDYCCADVTCSPVVIFKESNDDYLRGDKNKKIMSYSHILYKLCIIITNTMKLFTRYILIYCILRKSLSEIPLKIGTKIGDNGIFLNKYKSTSDKGYFCRKCFQ